MAVATREGPGQHSSLLQVKDFKLQNDKPAWRSATERQIIAIHEKTGEAITFPATRSSTVNEVKHVVAAFVPGEPDALVFKSRRGRALTKLQWHEECPNEVYVSGVRAFSEPIRQYPHPILVVGGGLGGIQCMLDMKQKGRTDFVCMEKHPDWGGHSWITIPNKFTKLQTEKGTYMIDYMDMSLNVPDEVGDTGVPYKSWPSRDTILMHFRDRARYHGLDNYTMFNTEIQKVAPAKKEGYSIQYLSSTDDEADGSVMVVSAVQAFPGFLHELNTIEFPGEEDFGGYMEYSSYDMLDYTKCTGKEVVLYGHGAFTIENVRTLCEHRARKIYVVCRNRNLCGTKMASWLVSTMEKPVPAPVLLDCFRDMYYPHVDFDPWTANGVSSDSKRTTALIVQKTIFGVTDIYFLAGYFGVMEVVENEQIVRVSYMCAHLKSGKALQCDCLIKAIGTRPSFKVQKQLGMKELVGFWVNGDPMRPISIGAKGVHASNFASFSLGPNLAPIVKIANWFVDYPEDYELIREGLPVNKPDTQPAYMVPAQYGLPLNLHIMRLVPKLAMVVDAVSAIKAARMKVTHPLEKHLAQCKAEWDMYTQFFRQNDMCNDRPDPPYPYTLESMRGFIARAQAQTMF